jgi:hypothetical protein
MTQTQPSPVTTTYLISPSQFRAHKDCPQRHQYVYGQGLRPKATAPHFVVGSYFHELMHFYGQLLKAGYVAGDIHTIAAMDAKLQSDLEIVQDEFIPTLLRVHLMFRRYMARRTVKIDSNIEIIEAEMNVEFAMNSDVGIMGIIDLLYRRKGRLTIRDYKTGENKSNHSSDSIEMNDQLLTYACVVWKLYDEVPDIEIEWVNSKVDYKTPPTNEQLFETFHKTLDKKWLEAWWTYTIEYVYHMQSVPSIRLINDYKCKKCDFKEPCNRSLRGLDVSNLIAANYKVVSRNHDFAKFTEIARKKSDNSIGDSRDSGRGDSSEMRINFVTKRD